MKGATCPACGVAVLPGYARCPNKRCRKPLPRRAQTQVEGGTSVTEETKRWPLFAAIGAALIGTIAIIMLGRGGDEKPKVAPQVAPTQQPDTPERDSSSTNVTGGGSEMFYSRRGISRCGCGSRRTSGEVVCGWIGGWRVKAANGIDESRDGGNS